MNLFKSFSFITLFLTATLSYAQNKNEIDCTILKNIKLKYINVPDTTALVVIKGTKHVEYLGDGKYFIKSDLEWLSDCEYNAKMTEITVPNFPFKAGDVLNFKFEKIENGFVYGTAKVFGKSFSSKFKIIK